ncbi:phosphotransferase [Clostridium sp. 'deep sea']|uniref:aminoglycoside phosphotransferase family protein n=1 Tax=Clostridium sp. 'deep sea' TaxID=2779445 RepID=UPI0018967A06|nr:phosphotransferase [Clostridium sp. 'deep sea']QOR35320.1 phosphotransferase [Clostridium sp. 'deep sea']
MVNLADIKGYSNWSNIKPITLGWSNDLKYKVLIGEDYYILRLSDIKYYEHKKREYEMLQQINSLNLNITRPVDFGVCNNNQHVYLLLTWLKGNDAEQELPKLSKKKQYDLGVKAGENISKIHSLKPTFSYMPWHERFNKKIDKKIKSYLNCSVKFNYEKEFLNYIEQNRHLLQNRPTRLLHGDFHVGNMIINEKEQLGIIDFNRQDIGDPWEDFNRMPFSVRTSQAFSVGMLNGYFNNSVPIEFFSLFCLYLVNNAISSIPWSIPFGKKEVAVAFRNIEAIYSSYQGFATRVPQWYSQYQE